MLANATSGYYFAKSDILAENKYVVCDILVTCQIPKVPASKVHYDCG